MVVVTEVVRDTPLDVIVFAGVVTDGMVPDVYCQVGVILFRNYVEKRGPWNLIKLTKSYVTRCREIPRPATW